MSHPNFPRNLSIAPFILQEADADKWHQHEAINKYGIAGRVWEATRPLLQYLTSPPPSPFEPPCSALDAKKEQPRRIIELGSGQAVASLHLAKSLNANDTLLLTDLPDVVPLCQQSLNDSGPLQANVLCLPLTWGEEGQEILDMKPFTHILMCDLIYFPELFPPLLHTLLRLTEPSQVSETETFGPEIILSYKSRTISLEQAFFDSLSLYFKSVPVIGGDFEERIFICQRWRISEEWSFPEPSHIMRGAPGVIRGRDFGLIDLQFASMEW